MRYPEQPDDIIADRRDGETFDSRLQPQLQPRALVHRAQQITVLLLDLHIDPGAQQTGGARELLGQIRLPLLRW